MNIVFIVAYATFCLLVAFAGRRTRIGFFGVLIFSIFMTPLLVAILIVFFQPDPYKAKRKKKKR